MDEITPELHQLFQSLLGAVAYFAHTRTDVVVFISALQRHSAKSKIEHIAKLNKLVTWIQRHPKKLHYKCFNNSTASGNRQVEAGRKKAPDTHLRVVSDAAFKRETVDGYSLRGVLFLRCEGGQSCFNNTNTNVHVLDYICKAQRHVCRSTFAAELLGACDAADQGVLIAQMLYEISHEVLSASDARRKHQAQ